MSWRLARSLSVLRCELDAAHPNRSTGWDGTVGDEAHSARTSDHNPNESGVVCAADVTHDPVNGVDGSRLAHRATLDPRTKYVIWNRRIWSRDRRSEGWRPYEGDNPHDHHVHISVGPGVDLYDSPKTWGVAAATAPQGGFLMSLSDEQQKQLFEAVARLDVRRQQDEDLPQKTREIHNAVGRVDRSLPALLAGMSDEQLVATLTDVLPPAVVKALAAKLS